MKKRNPGSLPLILLYLSALIIATGCKSEGKQINISLTGSDEMIMFGVYELKSAILNNGYNIRFTRAEKADIVLFQPA